MKVSELAKELSKFDQNQDLVIYTEDETLVGAGQLIRLLDVKYISEGYAEKCRTKTGEPMVTFEQQGSGKKHLFLELTIDF